MANIIINGKPLEVPDGSTVFQAAETAGIHIPHLCYHPAFLPEGSCRMCLVEIEGAPKLELACSVQVREGMNIATESDLVEEARKGVLEFLLAEHPPDCPICDKAGECKLQDYYELYGLFESEFLESKERKTKIKSIGKNLIMDQERCVLCTRCARFLRNITKTGELGVLQRGIRSVVDIYENQLVNNLYSGNLAEICPVGAITDSDFRFQTRIWFLKSGESICPHCSRGCSIYIDSHKGFARFPLPKRVYRIRARKNDNINGHWICDLGRYGYGYLNENRQDSIYSSREGKAEYADVLSFAADRIKGLNFKNRTNRIAVIGSSWMTNEELFLIKKIFQDDLGTERIYFPVPEYGEKDDFLLTEERSPNLTGLKEMGFETKEFDLQDLAKNTELLMIFSPDFESAFKAPELKAALELIDSSILFTSWQKEWALTCDFVMPVSLIAEKSGSLTNCDGIIQIFQAALDPVGESCGGSEFLIDLGKSLDMNFNYYKYFSDPDDIREKMREEIPFFGKSRG